MSSDRLDEILGPDPFADDPRPPVDAPLTGDERWQQAVAAEQDRDYYYTG